MLVFSKSMRFVIMTVSKCDEPTIETKCKNHFSVCHKSESFFHKKKNCSYPYLTNDDQAVLSKSKPTFVSVWVKKGFFFQYWFDGPENIDKKTIRTDIVSEMNANYFPKKKSIRTWHNRPPPTKATNGLDMCVHYFFVEVMHHAVRFGLHLTNNPKEYFMILNEYLILMCERKKSVRC